MDTFPSFILVTDRNPHIRALICRLLDRRGYTTQTVGDGKALCGVLATTPSPDLVILDPELPGMDLPSVRHEMEKWTQRIPVVLHAFGAEDEAAWQPRAATMVEKDVDLDKLVRCVAGLLGDTDVMPAPSDLPGDEQ